MSAKERMLAGLRGRSGSVKAAATKAPSAKATSVASTATKAESFSLPKFVQIHYASVDGRFGAHEVLHALDEAGGVWRLSSDRSTRWIPIAGRRGKDPVDDSVAYDLRSAVLALKRFVAATQAVEGNGYEGAARTELLAAADCVEQLIRRRSS